MELYDYEKQHRDLLRRLAPECMVLLKTDGSFPLAAPGQVALYGSGARDTIKGGTGSGDVNVRHYTTVEEGLENAGFVLSAYLNLPILGVALLGAAAGYIIYRNETEKTKNASYCLENDMEGDDFDE